VSFTFNLLVSFQITFGPCRHYHKAVWSERKYQQLLSSSSTAPPTALPTASSDAGVRRQLSSTFAAIPLNGVTSVADTTSREYLQAGSDATPTSRDVLQNSSDSVFLDNASQDRLLGNWEQPAASPQIPVRRRGQPNPLTSCTSRQISSSADYQTTRRGSHQHPLEWGAGPYSPMSAVGNKSRTPSGK
jgi:hypothetical protein